MNNLQFDIYGYLWLIYGNVWKHFLRKIFHDLTGTPHSMKSVPGPINPKDLTHLQRLSSFVARDLGYIYIIIYIYIYINKHPLYTQNKSNTHAYKYIQYSFIRHIYAKMYIYIYILYIIYIYYSLKNHIHCKLRFCDLVVDYFAWVHGSSQ